MAEHAVHPATQERLCTLLIRFRSVRQKTESFSCLESCLHLVFPDQESPNCRDIKISLVLNRDTGLIDFYILQLATRPDLIVSCKL